MLATNPYALTTEPECGQVLEVGKDRRTVIFSGPLSRREVVAADRLLTRYPRPLLGYLAFSALFAGAVFAFYGVIGRQVWFAAIAAGWLFALLLLVPIINMVYAYWHERRNQRQGTGWYASVYGTVGPIGVEFKTTTATSLWKWTAWAYYLTTPEIVVLGGSPCAGVRILARSQFEDEGDWQRLQELLAEHLPRK